MHKVLSLILSLIHGSILNVSVQQAQMDGLLEQSVFLCVCCASPPSADTSPMKSHPKVAHYFSHTHAWRNSFETQHLKTEIFFMAVSFAFR